MTLIPKLTEDQMTTLMLRSKVDEVNVDEPLYIVPENTEDVIRFIVMTGVLLSDPSTSHLVEKAYAVPMLMRAYLALLHAYESPRG